jgi:hypothetical protein
MTPTDVAGTTIDELLRTADLLLAGHLDASAAARHRGASFALRTALEIAIDRTLEAAIPGLSRTTMRAKLLCLRHYTAPETAVRASALWHHVCLGCHYHQYEMGPTHAQVNAWRHEIAAVAGRLAPRSL